MMTVEILATDFADAVIRMFDRGTIIPVLGILLGCSVAMIAIVAGAMRQASQTKAREKTRSEIAAYIAEGSMTPEEGERLLNAGAKNSGKGCCG